MIKTESYICIFHNSSQVELDYDHNKLVPFVKGKSIPYIIYETIKDNEVVIVLTRHNFFLDNVSVIVEFLLKLNIDKILFFIEDVFILYQNENVTRSYDLDIIEQIVNVLKIEYEVFHCEYNTYELEKIYNFKIQYCDVFLLSTAMFLYGINQIDYHFDYKLTCFNARDDIHRYIISSLIYKNSDVLTTLLFRKSTESIINNTQIPLVDFSKTVRDQIILGCQDLENNDIDLSWDIKYRKNTNIYKSISSYRQTQNSKIIQKSAVNLVTETRFYSNMPNFSEKVLKPMSVGRPFLLLAPPHTLKLIKDLGFKTFDKWWDESYDNITNHSHRLEAVYNISQSLLSKSNTELTDMLKDMESILKHNSNHIRHMYEPMMKLNNILSNK